MDLLGLVALGVVILMVRYANTHPGDRPDDLTRRTR